MRCALALILYKLGVNFYECEEASEGLGHLKKALELFNTLPDALKLRHLNSVQDLYNHIAIIQSDRDHSQEALDYLEKSEEVYQIVAGHTQGFPVKSMVNNFDRYLLKQSCRAKEGAAGLTSDSGRPESDAKFTFYINQGLDLKQLESKYTTTLFILAQVHSKLNNVDEGIRYCAMTMKRQLSQGQYDLKDWVVNATTLADAFLAREHFCQAEYLLFAAFHVLPEDLGRKKGLRAMVQLQLGRYYQRRLEVGVLLHSRGLEFDKQKVSQRFVEFPELKLNWPELKDVKSLDDAKTLFRLANTMFKKALEHYQLDGFVTEHVQIKQGVSLLYKHLAKLELDLQRCELMHTRRAEMLEFLKSELNPNAYQVRLMEFGAELSEIYGELYEIELRKPRKAAVRLNELAAKSMENAALFTQPVYARPEDADRFDYFPTVLNLELSGASKLTKWITADPRERIAKTKDALDIYLKLQLYVKDYFKFKGISGEAEVEDEQVREQIRIVREMAELLPQKLDKMSAALGGA
uniref:KIF-binding protein n=1 Tax=Strombidium rassoulzadegani TaxID=1082188 RepID=A0A7S3CST0_9SPIT|mmetsp:Transcript_7449/g.12591  ORF Transcript_7449/g.12591 Transcript_7449/m.12591 type:complete len:522 (+) Transcript_7449:404-1969(+)